MPAYRDLPLGKFLLSQKDIICYYTQKKWFADQTNIILSKYLWLQNMLFWVEIQMFRFSQPMYDCDCNIYVVSISFVFPYIGQLIFCWCLNSTHFVQYQLRWENVVQECGWLPDIIIFFSKSGINELCKSSFFLFSRRLHKIGLTWV